MIVTQEQKQMLRSELKLSQRQAEIVGLLLQGIDDSARMARRMGLSPGTVKLYLHHTYKKTGTSSRVNLVLHVLAGLGLIPD